MTKGDNIYVSFTHW